MRRLNHDQARRRLIDADDVQTIAALLADNSAFANNSPPTASASLPAKSFTSAMRSNPNAACAVPLRRQCGHESRAQGHTQVAPTDSTVASRAKPAPARNSSRTAFIRPAHAMIGCWSRSIPHPRAESRRFRVVRP